MPGSHNKLLGPGNLVLEELFLVDRDHGSPIAANDQAADRDRGDGGLMSLGDDPGLIDNCWHYLKQRFPVKMHDGSQLLTPGEVALMFRVDPKTVTRWASTGRIGSVRTPGGHRRFLEADIKVLLDKLTTEAGSPTAAALNSQFAPVLHSVNE